MLPVHVNNFERSANLNVLASSTQYRICVIGLSDRLLSAMSSYATHPIEARVTIDRTVFQSTLATESNAIAQSEQDNNLYRVEDAEAQTLNQSEAILMEFRNSLMHSNDETPISKCTDARTLPIPPIVVSDQNRLTDQGFFQALLSRRLGLIVGCCLGVFVFFIIITILGWLKVKKRRLENAKRQEQQDQLNYQHRNHPDLSQTHIQPPPDYNTAYRQFAVAYDDLNCGNYPTPPPPPLQQQLQQQSQHPHPNCISGAVIGTTTIAC